MVIVNENWYRRRRDWPRPPGWCDYSQYMNCSVQPYCGLQTQCEGFCRLYFSRAFFVCYADIWTQIISFGFRKLVIFHCFYHFKLVSYEKLWLDKGFTPKRCQNKVEFLLWSLKIFKFLLICNLHLINYDNMIYFKHFI